jgi:hypothetical protein
MYLARNAMKLGPGTALRATPEDGEAIVMKLILGPIAACAMLLAFAGTALGSHPGKPDNVYTGPPPEFCPLFYDPVHDIHGTTYLNECSAALQGSRVTWDGIAP